MINLQLPLVFVAVQFAYVVDMLEVDVYLQLGGLDAVQRVDNDDWDVAESVDDVYIVAVVVVGIA
jgi:hypothetical protein